MRRILIALFLLASLTSRASAFETSLAGEWKLAGADAKGSYTGTAAVSRLDDGRYAITFKLDYGQGKSGSAFFLGTAAGTTSGTSLDGERGDPNGIVGALANAPKNAVPAHYKLSDDGTTLAGDFGTNGSFKERLTRTLAPTAKIVILHTNDVHGQVYPLATNNGQRGGVAALVAKLRKERAAALAEGASVLTLDAGDIYAGTPEGDETHGIVDLDCMKLAGYDAFALGNHEFDQSVPIVKELVGRATFPVLSANLVDETTKKLPAWKNLAGSARFNVAGVRVCVIGLMTSDLKKVTTAAGSAGVNADPEEVAARRELAANADAQVNVLLTHVGSDGDRKLAEALEARIAAIVGGHTHEAIANPKRWPDQDGALVAQAGKSGQFVGKIEIEVDRATGKVTSVTGQLLPVSPAEGEAADAKEAIQKGAGAITGEMDAVIGSISKPLVRKGQGSTSIGNFVADAIRAQAHSEIGIYNKTGIRGELAQGDVHLRDIYQVTPFADHNVVMTLKGKDLLAVLEGALAPKIGSPPALEISGLTVAYDLKKPAGQRVRSVKVNGQPLDPKKGYRVVTGKFLSEGGDGHVAFTKGTDLADSGGSLMDALRAQFHGKKLDVPATEARWGTSNANVNANVATPNAP